MPAPYIHTFDRKLLDGDYARISTGSPNLPALVEAAIPGRKCLYRASGGSFDILVCDEPELTGQQVVDLANAYDAWTPAPSTDEDLFLDDFVSGHYEDYRQVDYKTGLTSRLHKQISDMFRGEVRQVRYFTDETETDIVIQVDVAYNRQANGLATDRTTTRTWYKKNGQAQAPTKVTVKQYDNLHAMREGKRRRENVIDTLLLDVLAMLVVTETAGDVLAAEAIGMPYLAKHSARISDYKQTGDLDVKTDIAADPEAWLDNDVTGMGKTGPTIRDEILNSLVEIYA